MQARADIGAAESAPHGEGEDQDDAGVRQQVDQPIHDVDQGCGDTSHWDQYSGDTAACP